MLIRVQKRKFIPLGSPVVRSLTIQISSMFPNLLKASRKSSSVTDLPQTIKSLELGGSSCLLSFDEVCESRWRSPETVGFRSSAILHPFHFLSSFFRATSSYYLLSSAIYTVLNSKQISLGKLNFHLINHHY